MWLFKITTFCQNDLIWLFKITNLFRNDLSWLDQITTFDNVIYFGYIK